MKCWALLGHFSEFGLISQKIAPIEGFAFLFRFLHWAACFVISLTWNNTHSWGVRIYI